MVQRNTSITTTEVLEISYISCIYKYLETQISQAFHMLLAVKDPKKKKICLLQLCSNLTPGQVQDIPEPDFLSKQSGIAADFHTLSRGDGMASVSLSDWSSLTFSTPFMIPTSKLPAESTSAI
jgi:hypothetical protein